MNRAHCPCPKSQRSHKAASRLKVDLSNLSSWADAGAPGFGTAPIIANFFALHWKYNIYNLLLTYNLYYKICVSSCPVHLLRKGKKEVWYKNNAILILESLHERKGSRGKRGTARSFCGIRKRGKAENTQLHKTASSHWFREHKNMILMNTPNTKVLPRRRTYHAKSAAGGFCCRNNIREL